MKEPITIKTEINAPIEKVWDSWTTPKHIVHWNNASVDWFTPRAENNLIKWWRFLYRMEAIDGSSGFDFSWVYDDVKIDEFISYRLDDGRKVTVRFIKEKGKVKLIETFDPEDINPIDVQRKGWQAILDNFKRYTESL